MNILTEVCLSHNELFFPHRRKPHMRRRSCMKWSGVRAHARTCQLYILCQYAVSTGAQACTHTQKSSHSRLHTVIWWLWLLMSCCGVYPTRMVDVAWGQPPPAFNDVYLAHVWGVNWGGGVWVCVCVCMCVTGRCLRWGTEGIKHITPADNRMVSRPSVRQLKEHDWRSASAPF